MRFRLAGRRLTTGAITLAAALAAAAPSAEAWRGPAPDGDILLPGSPASRAALAACGGDSPDSMHDGFAVLTTWDSACQPVEYRIGRSYVIQLAETGSGSVEALRVPLARAAAQIVAATDIEIAVAPRTIAPREPLAGEIVVMVDRSCGEAYGCATSKLGSWRDGESAYAMTAGSMWIRPDQTVAPTIDDHPWVENLIAHELGHALGLAHYQPLYQGRKQVMNRDSTGYSDVYLDGDLEGLRYVSSVPPTVTTGAATDVTTRGATLNGTVTANGSATQYFFEWGSGSGYGNVVPATPASAGSGTSAVAVSQPVGGLSPKATYRYRLVARNVGGTTYGPDRTFRARRVVSSANGDRLADLIAIDSATGRAVVTTSTGSAFNGPSSGQWLASWPYRGWMRTGDFNGDGKADVVAKDPANNRVVVAISNGASFDGPGSGEWLRGWSADGWMEVGDVNGDGKDDLIAQDPANNRVVVTTSTGSSFNGPNSGQWTSGWSAPAWLRVGDFNGDGKDDLITKDPANNRVVATTSTGSSFNGLNSGEWLRGWSAEGWMEVGDVNGDGKDDLVAKDPANNRVAVTTSTGISFNGAYSGQWLSGWAAEGWMRVADVNGDGKDDLVAKDPANNRVVATPSTGVAFGGPNSGEWLSGWAAEGWMEMADINGDGRADVVAADPASSRVVATTSTGTSFNGPNSGQWLGGWNAEGWTEIGDFNGDGRTDLVTKDPANNRVVVSASTGGGFNGSGSGGWLRGWSQPGWMRVGDFNGDGKDDLVAKDPANNRVVVAISNGASFDGPGSGEWLRGWAADGWMEVGDFNGDGKDDLVAKDPARNRVVVTTSTGTSFNGPDSGQWLSGWAAEGWMRVGDFNGDGKDDLVAKDPARNRVVVTTSTGSSFNGLNSGEWLSGWAAEGWMEVGDVNGDDVDDLVAKDPARNRVVATTSTGSSFNGPNSGQWLSGWAGEGWLRVG